VNLQFSCAKEYVNFICQFIGGGGEGQKISRNGGRNVKPTTRKEMIANGDVLYLNIAQWHQLVRHMKCLVQAHH